MDEIFSDDISSPDQVTTINNNFRRLYSNKLDIHPGSLISKRDSTYDLGAFGNEWATLYVDTITATAGIGFPSFADVDDALVRPAGTVVYDSSGTELCLSTAANVGAWVKVASTGTACGF